MAVSPTPAELAAEAKCFLCMDNRTLLAVQTYLIASTANAVAETSMDPSTLANLARCYSCLTEEQMLQIQVYLLCAILNA